MKDLKSIIVFVFLTSFISCSSSDSSDQEIEIQSSSKELISLQLEYKQSIFNCTIIGNSVDMDRPLPIEADNISIKSIVISTNATSNKIVGDVFSIATNSQNITIEAEDGSTKSYSLLFNINNYTTIVDEHGLLQIARNKIVDKNNLPISLAGNSFFWSNNGWGGSDFYKASVVSWLKLDWNTTIVRAAMGVDEAGGYLESNLSNKNRVKTIVDASIDLGLYVIIDWHTHHAEDNTTEAVEFFEEMATLYGDYDNVIYEIYNEPLSVSWDDVIKPYAETVISAIRAIDPDNIIIVGTPEWSQRVDLAAENPITNYDNIAYTLHFYSVNHKQWLRDRASAALNSGIALFVTEWGVVGYTQNDSESQNWMQWCIDNDISQCSWAVNDKEEEWSIVIPNTNTNGSWNDSSLTDAGKITRTINRNW